MQTFRLDCIKDNICRIHPLSSEGGYGRVLDVFQQGATAQPGDNIDLWEVDEDREQSFIIKEISEDGCAILLASDRNLAVTCEAINENNANLYLDTFDGRKEQLFAFLPKENNGGGEWFAVLTQNAALDMLGKEYASFGPPTEILVEPDQGILFDFGGPLFRFEGSSAMYNWYDAYFETGIVPNAIANQVMKDDETCVEAQFFLKQISLEDTYMPETNLVGGKTLDSLYDRYCYKFLVDARIYTLYCNDDGSVDGDSYCIVALE